MDTTIKRPRGRPPGRRFRASRTLLMTEREEALAEALAEKWSMSVAATIRRAIAEAARREKVA